MDGEQLRTALRDLHEQIERIVGSSFEDGAICLGFVVVAEWADTQGQSWLSRQYGDSNGDAIPAWRRDGMLHHALFQTDTWDAPELELGDADEPDVA